jgi:hypothetical protein
MSALDMEFNPCEYTPGMKRSVINKSNVFLIVNLFVVVFQKFCKLLVKRECSIISSS